MSNNYQVVICFEGFKDPEISHYYRCTSAQEAISAAKANLADVWLDMIAHIDVKEI